ncbi:prestin-like isoform X2 [Cylas formicarius]|uniref:prestin-like isoform X2 n=1 Tax=Cylas formicarius TaxID=197179 RepID=UPI002958DE00|nr:prestin-like isoform X2 [Cylas formicarius]XP_060532845.1 prestin-like isoform X2 [Cylas formicarius]XP_060532846.1 prestin-like isoform X2 [Cylas formicarius]XP_060532847.1 prestin-like isoform X2 [Cylas formicarius]XP_060532849.1 prestin-like isoform X2 [Cylas formicarius]XP_060532850.1 prestin-like isoform X2 [Cylas formicarius]
MTKNEKDALDFVASVGVYDNDGAQKATPMHVERPIYQIEELNRDTLYERPYSTLKSKCTRVFSSISPLNCLFQVLPLLQWLPGYNWKRSFLSDIISGITVAIMHIPQGIAYGLLGGVPPIFGIYMAFFPVLVYFVFGTSRHVSIGTFAVVCLMTGKVVSDHASVEILPNGTARALDSNSHPGHSYTNVEVAITVTFAVAVIQLAMYVLRLGVVSTLLSDTLVNAFTCASAFHVASSQLKDLLGLHIGKRRGNFAFVYTIYDAVLALPGGNRTAIIISPIACVLLTLNNEYFKPWLAKKTKLPFPVELVAVVVGTAVTYFGDFHHTKNVSVVGYIPTGLPEPTLPAFGLIPDIWVDCVVITMVSYTITMSMALIFARKLMYEVDSNQELLALGLSNAVGSVFSCMPVTASLSRSMIQQTVGGVTQFASVVSAGLLLIVLLWVGPVFETLPRCVLASIIVVALKGMLMQFKSARQYWRLSKWDGLVWAVTFGVTLFIQISYGLAAGVAISFVSIFCQGYKPYTCLLGAVPNTDLYLDIKRYKAAQEIAGLKIFHYSGGLSFASRDSFRDLFVRKVGLDPQAILRKRAKLMERGMSDDHVFDDLVERGVVLDFSALTFLDPSGVEFLRQLQTDLAKLGITLYIAGCSGPVYEVMINCDKWERKESKFAIFPTVHDAVLYAQTNLLSDKDV